MQSQRKRERAFKTLGTSKFYILMFPDVLTRRNLEIVIFLLSDYKILRVSDHIFLKYECFLKKSQKVIGFC